MTYKFNRKYSDKTLKLLFGTCDGFCAHPSCTNIIIAPATRVEEPAVLGQIAHIYSTTSEGPRPYQGHATESFVNGFENLILLCGFHHDLVDEREASFTAEEMKVWKDKQCGRHLSSRHIKLPIDLALISMPKSQFALAVDNGVVLEVGVPES
jgi:hypothetical protein